MALATRPSTSMGVSPIARYSLRCSAVIGDAVADRGYDARAILELIAARGGRGHIPTQRDRKLQRSVDPAFYRQRNLVERFFNKLKHFRKIDTHYEKSARNYLAAVLIASVRLWARHYESTS